MVSRTQVAKQVRGAFEPARQELSSRQSQVESRIREQQQAISQQQQALQSQQAVRNISLQERQRLSQQFGSVQERLTGALEEVGTVFGQARERLSDVQSRAIETVAKRASRIEEALGEQSIAQAEEAAGQSLSAEARAEILADVSRQINIQEQLGQLFPPDVDPRVSTTFLERELGLSLPRDIRGLTPREIIELQSVPTQELRDIRDFPAQQFQPEVQPATLEERLLAQLRQTTGISLPSGEQTFGLLARGIEPGEPQPEITTFDVIAAPGTIGLRGVSEAGRVAGELVTLGAEQVGFPTITQTIPAQAIPQRVTAGGEFILPESEFTFISPQQLGAAARFGTEIGLLGAAGRVGAGGAFLLAGGRTALDPREEIRSRIFGGAQAALGGVLLGSAARQALTQQRLIFRQPLPEPQIRVVREQVPVTLPDGRVIFRERFRQVAVQPARFESRASILQQLRGQIPDPTQITPRITIRAADIPQLPTLIDAEGNVILGGFTTRREGARLTQVSGLGGTGREFSLAELQQLTPTQRAALLRGVGGRTGSLIGVREDVRFLAGQIETRRAFRITSDPRTKEITLTFPEPGRITRRFETVTAVRPLPDQPNLFQTVSGAGEVTFGGTARKITRTEGVIKIKEPTILDSPGSSRILTGKKPTFTKQVQEQSLQRAAVTGENIQQAVTNVLRQKVRSGALQRAVTKAPTRPASPIVSLGLVQEATPQIAEEAVTLTAQQAATLPAPAQQPTLIQIPGVAQLPRERLVQPLALEITQQERSAIKQRAEQLSLQIQQQRMKQLATQGFAQPLALSQRQRSSQIEKQLLATLTTQKQLLEQRQQSAFRQPPQITGRPRPRPPTPPTPQPVPLPTGEPARRVLTALRKLKGQGVDVIVSRGNKKTTIAKNVPRFSGLKKGLDNLSDTFNSTLELRATKKKPKGKDIKEFSIPTNEFRPSKKDPLKIVERKEFRLDTAREATVLQRERKAKGGFKGRKKKVL